MTVRGASKTSQYCCYSDHNTLADITHETVIDLQRFNLLNYTNFLKHSDSDIFALLPGKLPIYFCEDSLCREQFGLVSVLVSCRHLDTAHHTADVNILTEDGLQVVHWPG